ncbi:hypothetical protein LTR28_009360, partial [Elasticomyces elasticus]
MPALLPIFKKAYWSLGALVAGYVTVLLLLTSPWLQRQDLLEQDTSLEATAHITSSKAFRLLTRDPDAKIVINYTYRSLTGIPNTHVLTIDYRGFGLSTGSPTEAGLITDGVALVNWVIDVAGIPPDRIVILGQSLGTAVASAVALRFADPASDLFPIQPTGAAEVKKSIVFAGV